MKEISPKCLSYRGHDWVTVYRGDPHGASESWMECHDCGMAISEIEDQEMACEHKMRCIKCGYPLLKEFREKTIEDYPDEEDLEKATPGADEEWARLTTNFKKALSAISSVQ